MKKIIRRFIILFLVFAFTSPVSLYSISFSRWPLFPPGEMLKTMKVTDIVKMKAGDITLLTGKKLTITERISFWMLKKKMKREIVKNPQLTVQEFKKALKKGEKVILILVIVVALLLFMLIIPALRGKLD
ncbi:MAG: hypothetical protein IPH18_11925 [Chitinophagaceae bacterium]|nr:hypothetical protein [Chitinophagaceae bacterium]MBK8952682.1 hypothetical protein [Chitinophagaceae bacterium]